ncbi:ABC transporter permease protein [Chitinispirillum alkaliphilum]|nr:ABC transporter permease protein [Chitinispirillum alkaliphilum]
MNTLDRLAIQTGASVRESLQSIGKSFIFLTKTFSCKFHFDLTVRQMYELGVCSFPLILFVSIFSGFISILTYLEVTNNLHAAPILMGRMVGTTIFIEIGPAIVGLILSARLAARITAQIGTMKITEQLDAMVCLSLNPFEYIIQPRIIASVLMSPVFFVFSSLLAIISAQMLSTFIYGLTPLTFYNGMRYGFSHMDIVTGMVKVIIFTTINVFVGCLYGMNVSGGAQYVGKATRNAVVSSSLFILVANLTISMLFFS